MFRTITVVVLCAIVVAVAAPLTGQKAELRVDNRPKVAGKMQLHLRERKKSEADGGDFKLVERNVAWDVAKTAIIICDMWDDHYCKSAAQRVGVMAPKMNAVLTAARNHGVQIIHAPSETMYIYADYPERKRMIQAKPAKPPVKIDRWCNLDPAKEPPMPVDVSKCSCDDPVEI